MIYPAALAVTLAIELPVYAAVLVRTGLALRRRALLYALAVNLATHPVVWTVTGDPRLAVLIAAEAGAWLVEAALLYLFVRRDAALLLALSLAANASSFLAGVLVR